MPSALLSLYVSPRLFFKKRLIASYNYWQNGNGLQGKNSCLTGTGDGLFSHLIFFIRGTLSVKKDV